MKGFFKTTQNISEEKTKELPTEPLCWKCKLDKHCLSPKMKCSGQGKKGIMFIAEAPGKNEDEQGTQLIGKAGRLLRQICKDLSVDLDKDCFKINAVNCRPSKNRTPKKKEIVFCRPYVLQQIKKHKPTVIILLGKTALESIIGYRWKKDLGGIVKWRGWSIPEYFYNAWVCPTFHPSYLLREQREDIELVFRKDLKRAFSKIGRPLPVLYDYKSRVRMFFSERKIIQLIKKFIRQKKETTIDYETTGKKPQRKGHDIISCSLCNNEKRAYAFPLKSKKVRRYLIRFLKDKRIPKVAQNIKFEDIWSRVILHTKVKNWTWDPMLTSHIEDNRQGITGLKFQVYIILGIADYDSHLERFLKSKEEKNANSFNRIKKIPLGQLLLYNGLDSLFEKIICNIQRKRLGCFI